MTMSGPITSAARSRHGDAKSSGTRINASATRPVLGLSPTASPQRRSAKTFQLCETTTAGMNNAAAPASRSRHGARKSSGSGVITSRTWFAGRINTSAPSTTPATANVLSEGRWIARDSMSAHAANPAAKSESLASW